MSCLNREICHYQWVAAAREKMKQVILLVVISCFSVSLSAQTKEPNIIEMILSGIVSIQNEDNRQLIEEINFADAGLEACIDDVALEFGLTFADEVTSLTCDDMSITSLSGLAHFTSLTQLSLNNNSISSFAVVEGLTSLESFSAGNNGITTIFDVSALENLHTLALWQNSISLLTALEDLVVISNLDLSENNIANLAPLRRLTTLTQLNLSQNRVSNVAPIQNLVALTRLELWGNTISDISLLVNYDSLTYLDLYDNQISDITAIGSMPALTYLDLYGNSVSDLSPLESLTALQVLDLGENEVTDISSLADLTTLRELTLYLNDIGSVDSLSELVLLYYLDLGNTGIDDIAPLAGLVELETLYLDGNSIQDVSALAAMVNMQRLYLADNMIDDIFALRGMVNLVELELAGNDDIDCVDTDDPLTYADIPSECLAGEPGALLAGEFVMLSDINDDGLNDIGIFLVDDITGVPTLQILSAWDLSEIKRLTWPAIFESANLLMLPDMNGNGVKDVAVYGSRNDAGFEGRTRAISYDPLTDETLATYNWPNNYTDTSVLVLADLTSDGVPEVGLQGRISSSNRPQMVVRNGASGRGLYNFGLPDLFSQFNFVQLSDLNDDGVDDIGIIGLRRNNGTLQIRTFDGTSPSNRFGSYNFGNKWTNTEWNRLSDTSGDGVDDWGLFGRRTADNRYQVIHKSGASTRGILRIHTWQSDYAGATWLRVPDMTSDGIGEIALAGQRSNNRYQITVKNGNDRSDTLGNWAWPNNWTEVSLIVIPDQNGDGLNEFALFGKNGADAWQVVVKDGSTRAETKRYELGSSWSEKPEYKTGDTNFDDVEDLIFYGENASSEPYMQIWSGSDTTQLY